MKMYRLILGITLIVSIVWSCSQRIETGQISISGHAPEMAGKDLRLEELLVRDRKLIDSTTPGPEGNFAFTIRTHEAGFYILSTSADNQLIIEAEPNDSIRIEVPHENFKEGYSIKGSEGSRLLQSYEKELSSKKEQIDSLAEIYYAARGTDHFMEKKKELDSAYAGIVEQYRDYISDFIDAHPGQLSSLIVLNRKLGNNQVIDEEKDFRLFHLTDSALMKNYPENKHVLDHHERVKQIRLRIFDKALAEEKLMPGKKAPDIVLNDTAGQPFSLKSYYGDPVIVYFWAGWSAKSRVDNKKLVSLYDQLAKDGIKILGVSLDENAVVWKGAIKLDSLPWKQVSDLEGLHSKVKEDYNLPNDLPFYYLLDKKHKIVYKNNNLDSLLIHLDKLFL